MKIEKKEFVDFLSKVQMSGTQQIIECVFNFDDDGLSINADCPTEQSKIISMLKPSAFQEYAAIGKIGVNDFGGFIGALKRFNKLLTMTQEGNVLIVEESKKKVEVELINIEFIKEPKEIPDLKYAAVFKLPPKQIQDIFADAKLSKDAVIIIETATDQIRISNTGKYKFTNVFDAKGCPAGIKCKYGEPLVDAIAKLDGEIQISISDDYPIEILETSENTEIKIIVAPRVDEA